MYIFSQLAAKSAPSRQVFLASLAAHPSQLVDPDYEPSLQAQIEAYVTHSDRVMTVVKEFYCVNGLEVVPEGSG